VFLSHFWGESQANFIACLEQYVTDHGHHGADEDTLFWVCAFANNQHQIGEELQGGVESSPFVRAIAMADRMVTIVDPDGVVFTRAWCAYESYEATVRSGSRFSRFSHELYTATQFEHKTFGTRSYVAAGLVDGYAAGDQVEGRTVAVALWKAEREAHFPRRLAEQAAAFDLRTAQASMAEDAAAILAAVGADVHTVNATVRARFQVGLLPALLEGKNMGQLRALCKELRASELRALTLSCAEEGKASAAAVELVAKALPPVLFDLSCAQVGRGSVRTLARRVESGQLRRLEMLGCGLSDADVTALASALGASDARLLWLDLR
jgi:hypothetical protein